jgi:long-chain acyl-CoA synthetase
VVEYSITKNFLNAVEQFQDKISLETRSPDGIKTLTYGELRDRVAGAAYYIASLGIEKGDRVSMSFENGQGFAIVFFALAYIGAVAVPLDPKMTEKDVKNILSDSGAKLFLTADKIKELAQAPGQGFKNTPLEPDDLMVLLYTSGTTDLPKGVMLTHKNLCANFYSLKKMKIFSPKDIILSVLPLYHSYSLMTTLIAPLFSGARIVYVSLDWPERLGEYIKTTGTTVFLGVPQIYHLMHNRMMKKLNSIEGIKGLFVKSVIALGFTKALLPKVKNAFGKRLRFFVSGGAKLDTSVARDFFKLGFKILEGYGLTETSPVASLNPARRPKVGSIGKPIPDVEMKIVSKDAAGVGEIAIKGPNVMKGYYKKEDKTMEVIKDGWFLSGDLGYVDKDGYFYITGRSKEVIVLSSGKNIYPEEIEKHYLKTPYVKEICVLGIIKERAGANVEYLHAIIVPDLEFFKERGEMNIERVIKNAFEVLSKDVPSYKHIMGFSITNEQLPRTILGKLKRYEIEKRYRPLILDEDRKEKALTDEEKDLLESETTTKLIACIKDSLGIEDTIHLNDSIELDLGVDSLARVELVLAIEKCFDIEFPGEMVAGEIFSVKDLVLKIDELKKVHKGISAQAHKNGEKAILWRDVLKEPLPFEFQKKILLYPGWSDYILTFLIKGVISLFFRVFYGLRVQGERSLPKKGPYVLCVNHTSFLDGFIIAAAVPFRIGLDLFFIAFRRYFVVPIVRNLVRRARIIPIDATEIIEAMQGASFILKHDKILCIFPEGERSIDGEPKEFKKGIGIVAKELNVALVPVYIEGAFQAWPRTERFPRLYPIKARFGEAVSSEVLVRKGMALGASDKYEAISMAIREELFKLK